MGIHSDHDRHLSLVNNREGVALLKVCCQKIDATFGNIHQALENLGLVRSQLTRQFDIKVQNNIFNAVPLSDVQRQSANKLKILVDILMKG